MTHCSNNHSTYGVALGLTHERELEIMKDVLNISKDTISDSVLLIASKYPDETEQMVALVMYGVMLGKGMMLEQFKKANVLDKVPVASVLPFCPQAG